MSGIGTIDAGSSVALTGASGAIIELLTELQQNQLKATTEASKVQCSMSQAQATATIENGQAQAQDAYASMGMAIAGAAVSGLSAASSLSSLRSLNAAQLELNTNTQKLNDLDLHVEGEAGAGNNPARQEEVNSLAAKIKKGEDFNIEGEIFDDKEAQIINEAVAERKEALKKAYDMKAGNIQLTSEYRTHLGKFVESGITASMNAVQADARTKQAESQAINQISGTASQQAGQVYSELAQARAKVVDEILGILQAKEAAISTIASSVRA